KRGGELLPRPAARAARRHRTERIKAEAQVDSRWAHALLAQHCRDCALHVLHVRTRIELDRNAGIKTHALERARDRRFGGRNAVAGCAARARENDAEPARAVLELLDPLCRPGG